MSVAPMLTVQVSFHIYTGITDGRTKHSDNMIGEKYLQHKALSLFNAVEFFLES